MKITKVTLAFSVLAVAGLFLGCEKPEPNVPPEPDTEVQSAIDATWATYVVTDIEMMCGFAGVDQTLRHFYTEVPGTEGTYGPGTGTMVAVRNNEQMRLSIVFNKTQCIDGRFRDGEVRMEFNPALKLNDKANPNSVYIDRFGFGGRLTLSDYHVDGWLVQMPEPGYLYNDLVDNQWDPTVTNLQWTLVGKFNFIDSNGVTQLSWSGNIKKILLNTSDPLVYTKNPTQTKPAITWSLATVGYHGQVTGFTNSVVPFNMEISNSNMLVRDFTCSPDQLGGVTLDAQGNPVQRKEEHHPFIKGIATFKTGDKYPRQIYFGNESNTSLSPQCDNTGEVMIKGIAYRVNFKK